MSSNVNADAAPTFSDLELLIAQQLELMSSQVTLLAARDGEPEQPTVAPSHLAPFRPLAPSGSYIGDFADRYNRAHGKSKAHADRHRAILADSRRTAGFRPATRSMLYPIVGVAARGAHMQDIDGNDYVDLTMGFGVLLTGHAPAFLDEAINAHRATGMDLGPQSPLAGEVATTIAEITGLPRVAFCNSGTEAVMTAIRLARAATRRTSVVMFANSYHGHFDGVLALGTGVPVSTGTPESLIGDLIVLEYGTDAALAAIRAHAGQLAAVLVEPVQSRDPGKQPEAFLHAVRDVCNASGAALIFDELLTGFRVAPGGAQEWFGIQADLATYGKIVGGGMPIGVIAGAERFLDGIDGGNWDYESGFPEADRVFFAGTFNKNNTTMAAAQAMLAHLRTGGPQLQAQLNALTADLTQRLNELFVRRGVAMRVDCFGSMFRFAITTNADLFFFHLIQNGIYIWEGRTCFLSTTHTPQDCDRVIDAVARSLDEMQAGGLFPADNGRPDKHMLTEATG